MSVHQSICIRVLHNTDFSIHITGEQIINLRGRCSNMHLTKISPQPPNLPRSSRNAATVSPTHKSPTTSMISEYFLTFLASRSAPR